MSWFDLTSYIMSYARFFFASSPQRRSLACTDFCCYPNRSNGDDKSSSL